MSKVAIVASGGGIKALAFHAGVLQALERGGFKRKPFDAPRDAPDDALTIGTYIGSSAGACFAAASIFMSSHDALEGVLGVAEGSWPRLRRRDLFRPSLSTGGLFYASGIERYIRAHLTVNDFRAIGPEMYVVATQLNSPRKVVFGPKDSATDGIYDPFIAYYNDVPISHAIAASVSVPGMFAPFRITNQKSGESFEYTDGEVRETLSIHVARDNAVDLVIVSNTWMPYSYHQRVGTISGRGVFAVLNQTLTQMIEQKIDRFRNETDRYRMAMDVLREFARTEGLTSAQATRLRHEVARALNYREMDEIYVAPDKNDSAFNLQSSWSQKKSHVRLAIQMGYERASRAVEEWRKRSKVALG